MGILDRFAGRRPAATLAAPRPSAHPGPKPDTDADVGQWGGATASYADARAKAMVGLITAGQLTPRVIAAMREHPQVSACLVVQTLPFLRGEATVECDDPDIREQVTTWWERISLEIMRSAGKALPYGYSPNVLVWDVDADTGGLYVRKVRDLDPPTCKPLLTKAGDYAGLVQNEGRENEVRLDGDAILQTLWLVEGMESGNLGGRSVLRAARQPWQDQQALNLYLLRGLERFGNPHVVARAPAGSDVVNQAEINAAVMAGQTPPEPIERTRLAYALQLAEGIRDNTAVALPSDRVLSGDGKDIGYAWSLDFLEASADSAGALADAIAKRDDDIARAILVPSLLLEGGDTVGSNALGQSHRDTFTENAQARRADFAAQLNRHLIDRFVTFNYGPTAPRARLKFAPLGDDDLARMWAVATALIASGSLPVDAEAVAARVGIPLTEDDEAPPVPVEDPAEELARRLTASGHTDEAAFVRDTTNPPAATPAPAAPVRESITLAAGNVDNLPEWKLPQSYDPPPFHRAPTSRERLATFRRVEDGLNRAEGDVIAALEELLEASRGRVLRQVEGILKRGGTIADVVKALATVDLGATGPYAAAWTDLQRTVWGLGLSAVAEELGDFADRVPTSIGRDGLAIVNAYAAASADRVTADLASRVRLELVAAYRSGVGRAGLAAAVSSLFEREAAGEGRGMRLTTRMLASRALNESRADAIERSGVPLRGAQYSALLDRRTCGLCERLDEQVIAIGDLDLAKFTPPVHHNCRCVWVWITTEEADFTPTWSPPPRTDVERYGSLVIE